MTITINLGWCLLTALAISVVFYTLGVQAGTKDGFLRGRAAGMKLGRMFKEQS